MPGASDPAIEVIDISKQGLRLSTPHGAHFLSCEDFRWFRGASAAHILNVAEATPGHYQWPDLDVDLSLQIIRNPSRFPLTAKTS